MPIILEEMMFLNKGDIILDGEHRFSVYAVLGSTVYVESINNVKDSPGIDLAEVIKQYRKIEIMKK